MNDNGTNSTERTVRYHRNIGEASDFVIKGSVVISIGTFILVESYETLKQGAIWIPVGFLMLAASACVATLGFLALARSTWAIEALIFKSSAKSRPNQRASKLLSFFFALLLTATLFGLYHRLGFISLS